MIYSYIFICFFSVIVVRVVIFAAVVCRCDDTLTFMICLNYLLASLVTFTLPIQSMLCDANALSLRFFLGICCALKQT